MSILPDNSISQIIIIKEIEKYSSSPIPQRKKITHNNGYILNNKNQIISLYIQGEKLIDSDYILPLINKLKNLKRLVINRSKISSTFFLEGLTQLNYLDLGDNEIKDLNGIKNNKNIKKLFLNRNKISNLNPLRGLNQLTTLILDKNRITNINPIENLTNLIELVLTDNKISDLSALKKLSRISSLYLYGNKINDIRPIAKLSSIRNLNLGANNITDISPLTEINELQMLWLISNSIENIELIQNLTTLKELSIADNKVKDISFVRSLTKLTTIHAQDNEISDIDSLKYLNRLETIKIENNNISNIDAIEKLKTLKNVELQKNPISILPPWIIELGLDIKWDEYGFQNGYVTLFDNPLKSPSIEIVKQGISALRRYFNRVEEEGLDYIYEVKLTLVGDGNAGKTSLQKRLLDTKAELPKEDKRTRGIEIKDWTFNISDKRHIAHIWDFGGQDVYYPVHRFFITENSVFVLLASTRQTTHNFDYWIPTIYQFGGKSPIIIGQTCHDGNKHPWNELGVYLSNEYFNIIKTQERPYYEINLPNENEGLEKIKSIIINQIKELPHYGKGLPSSWIPVRDILAILSKSTPCISFEKFKEICQSSNKESFVSLVDFTDLAQFLHDLGIILWYSKNEELRNWVILQPEWAMNAVYKIIDDEEIQKRNGNIIAEDFSRLWNEEIYADKHFILKKMLEVFKIAFPKKHIQQDYIIPARLQSIPSDKKWNENEPSLRLEYKFEFMPKGIINQVCAEISRHITSDEEVWNNAVNLHLRNTSTIGQVEEDNYNRQISIKTKGKDARALMMLVMESINNITSGYKGVKADINVPCICDVCKLSNKPTPFAYERLIEWSKKREFVVCNESGEDILIDTLLFTVGLNNPIKDKESMKNAKRIFVSYSKHDDNYLQDFQDHMVTLKSEGLVTSFDCREIEFGAEWDEEIKRKVDECDIMVCLVSVKFLNTDYITKIEIPKAIEQNKTIIPIIIKACDWETSELGKYQAAQRGKIVSLDKDLLLLGKIKSNTDEEKAAYWTAIIKEFRKKLFK